MAMTHARALTAGAIALLLAAGGALATAAPATAASAVSTGQTAGALAQEIAGPALATVTNPVFTGSPGAEGIFSGFDPALGITDGVVLSTGSAAAVQGPNTSGSTSTAWNTPGTPSVPGDTHDAAVLSFDFVPSTSQIALSYVFGSEEYPEYVGQNVNDGFAILVNGTNCAVLPDGTRMSVDNVNDHTNAQYYVDGTGSQITQMDGYSKPLDCVAAVNPGVTNHLEFAIADVGDTAYDSWLLVASHSIAPNTTPMAESFSTTVPRTVATGIPLRGTSLVGEPLSYATPTQPQHGSLTLSSSGIATYTPAAGYSGTDSFTYTATDSQGTSIPATVTITVAANLPPTANAVSAATEVAEPVAVTLSGSDPEGQPITYAVSGAPQHGTLTGTAPNLTYTPAAGFVGSDSFSYTVSDGTNTSAPATATITVAQNLPPVAADVTAATSWGTPVAITLDGSDTEGKPLTYAVTAPQHGSVTGAGASRTYTPDAGFSGADSFSYTVSDGRFTSAPATVTIAVQAAAIAVTGDLKPGGTIVITGTGFPSSTDVVLRFKSLNLLLGTVRTTPSGTFSFTTTIPVGVEPAADTVVALVGGVSAATTPATVTAAAVVTPASTLPDEGLAQTGASVPSAAVAAALIALARGIAVVAAAALRRRRFAKR